jgi:hypothetical protein
MEAWYIPVFRALSKAERPSGSEYLAARRARSIPLDRTSGATLLVRTDSKDCSTARLAAAPRVPRAPRHTTCEGPCRARCGVLASSKESKLVLS